MVPLGISQATTIRVGLAYGARDPAWVGRAGSASLVMAMGFMSVAALVIWLFPRDLASIFLDATKPENAPVLDLAVKFLFLAAIFQLADGAQVVGAAMLRGLQDTRVPMYYAAFGYWAVGLGGGAALAFWAGWQGVGVWIGLAARTGRRRGVDALALEPPWTAGLISRPARVLTGRTSATHMRPAGWHSLESSANAQVQHMQHRG